MTDRRAETRFPSAAEDTARQAELHERVQTPQTESPSYRIAYNDPEFLKRDELRPVRLQLELLKPELILQEESVLSTIVAFGSARIPDPETAAARLRAAEEALAAAPGDPDLHRSVAIARRMKDTSRYYDVARDFGRIVSESSQRPGRRRYVIVTGGGPGMMEAANRGADDVGAESIGLSIVLPHEQAPNSFITPKLSFQFHYFAIRKMHFLIRAKALACFPGGFGTMDELFEALTLIQTSKIAPMPILLFGESWWRRVVNFEAMVEEGVISPKDLDLFQYVETAEEGWRLITEFYGETPERTV